MPACYLMSWEPVRRRWTKMYRGERFCVSCKQLDAPESKLESYQAANEWWIQKRSEITSHQHNPPEIKSHLQNAPEIQEELQHLRWAQKRGLTDEVREINANLKKLEKYLEPSESDQSSPPVLILDGSLKSLFAQLVRITVSFTEQLDLKPVFKEIRYKELRSERLAADVPDSSLDERSIAHQVNLFLANLKDRVDAKQYSHGAYRGQSKELSHFVKFLGGSTPIEKIDEQKWAAYYQHIIKKIGSGEISPGYGRRLYRAAQSFTESLVWLKLIPGPGNLHDKRMRFRIALSEIKVFEREEITRLLSPDNREVVRLFVLLALNIGATQIDISDLRHDEIDWENGRLSRKRSKTSDDPRTPKVEYLLWPETFALLKKFRSSDPTRVLVTRSGKPWVTNGETFKDSIGLEFMKLKPALTFKYLRKTGATKLAEHPEFRAYAQLFLGHSPTSEADAHYVKPSQTRFDSAVAWLRQQFLSEVPVA